MPRLPLPIVCGYIPLARLLTKALKAPTPTPTTAPTAETQEESKVPVHESLIGKVTGARGALEDLGLMTTERKHHAREEMSEENLKESLGWT